MFIVYTDVTTDGSESTHEITANGFAINWPVTVLLLPFFAIGIVANSLLIFVTVTLREYKKVITHW